jgi:hypothetical protein
VQAISRMPPAFSESKNRVKVFDSFRFTVPIVFNQLSRRRPFV